MFNNIKYRISKKLNFLKNLMRNKIKRIFNKLLYGVKRLAVFKRILMGVDTRLLISGRRNVCSVTGTYRSVFGDLTASRHVYKDLGDSSSLPNFSKASWIMFNTLSLFNRKFKTDFQTTHTNNFIYYGLPHYFYLYTIHTCDIGFTGKTYKWSFKKNYWRFTFNRAHKTFLFCKERLKNKKTGKTKMRVFFNFFSSRSALLGVLYKIRRYNIFTQRGLKVKGFSILKKRGKISTYR